MSSYSDDSLAQPARGVRKQPVRQATLHQSSSDNIVYQPDRGTRSYPSLPFDFTADEGPRIVNIEEALRLYHPMVDHQAPFTKPHRKGEKSHEEITVHLAVNGKRPRTAHECRTAVVVKAPWGNKSDRWNILINGCRYFVIFEYGSWWSWNGDKEGLSHKAVAFPVEVSLRWEK